MRRLKKIIIKALDVLELYIPMFLFCVVFVIYLIMIAYRYFLNKQVNQLYELSQVVYLTCALLAASYGGRTDKHVVFPLLYDKCSEKVKLFIRLIGNAIVVAVSAVLLKPSFESMLFIARKKTFLLKIPFNYIYLLFMIFIVLTMLYYLAGIIKDLRSLCVKSRDCSD